MVSINDAVVEYQNVLLFSLLVDFILQRLDLPIRPIFLDVRHR